LPLKPSAGGAGGSQTLPVTFTPADLADYNAATAAVTIKVLDVTPPVIVARVNGTSGTNG
jgi:hypothetical protein